MAKWVLVIDDLHLIDSLENRDILCEMIRTHKQRHFILIGRGSVHGWLRPFQFAGIMESFDMSNLMLDKTCVKAFAKAYGVSITHTKIVKHLNKKSGGRYL